MCRYSTFSTKNQTPRSDSANLEPSELIFCPQFLEPRYCGAKRGSSKLTDACPSCADGCSGVWDHWKSSTSRVLGGNWYSTAAEADCDDPAAPGCGWRVREHLKTVNATCANDNLISAVEKRGAACFKNGACPMLGDGSAYNRSTNCWVQCFFSAVIGPTPALPAGAVPWTPLPAMASADLTGSHGRVCHYSLSSHLHPHVVNHSYRAITVYICEHAPMEVGT